MGFPPLPGLPGHCPGSPEGPAAQPTRAADLGLRQRAKELHALQAVPNSFAVAERNGDAQPLGLCKTIMGGINYQ